MQLESPQIRQLNTVAQKQFETQSKVHRVENVHSQNVTFYCALIAEKEQIACDCQLFDL